MPLATRMSCRARLFDRELLAKFAALTGQAGRADVGFAVPAHIARHLSELGVDAMGVDVSPAMIEVARGLNPNLSFEQGDMLRLPLPDGSFAGIAAFYSIIHIGTAALSPMRCVRSPRSTD